MAITAPTDITGCVAWKEARETGTITVDGLNNVTQFNDQVTLNHYTDILGTPKSGTRTHNGHNVIDFDGASLVGEYGGTEQTQPVSVSWCGISDDTYAASTAVVVGSARTNDLGVGISNGFWAIRIGATFYETSVAVSIGAFVTMSAVFNDTSSVVYVNGTDVTPAGIPTFTDRWRDGGLGAASTATASPIAAAVSYFNGAFCEYCAHDLALTSTNATDIHNYFVSNWAAAGSAPTISSVSNPKFGETVTITVDDSTGVTSATYGGIALTSVATPTGTTVTGVMPSGGLALGSSNDFTVTNGSGTSAGFSATYEAATGYSYVTWTADSTAFSTSSPLYNTGRVTGDQLMFEQVLDPTTSVSNTAWDAATGIPTLSGTISVDNTTTIYDLDASSSYAATSDTINWNEQVAPTVSSIAINATGDALLINGSEALNVGADGVSGLTIATMDGGSITLGTVSGTGTTQLSIAITNRTVYDWEGNTTADYTQPGDGITDNSNLANLLASFAGTAVTNGSAVNASPTDIALSSTNVSMDGGANAVVGTLSTTDPDSGDSHTYSLVAGTGDTNNASFNILSNQLRCTDPAALGVGTYSVRIQTDDGVSTPYAEAFTINVVAAGVVTTTSILCLMAG